MPKTATTTAKRASITPKVPREKPNPFIVKKSVQINATPAEVWDALTNSEKTKKYFFHCAVFSDWQVGGSIMWKGTMMFIKKIELHGEIVKIEPEKLLMYTLTNEGSDSISTVTDKLTYANGITTVTVTDDVGKGAEAEERFKKSEKGWEKVLKGLKEVVENR